MKAQCRCGKIVIIPNVQMGQTGECPRCHNKMLIPTLVGQPSPETSGAPAAGGADFLPLPPKEAPPPVPVEKPEEPPALPEKKAEPAGDRLREVKPCPYCGEEVEIYLEPEIQGTLVQDCEVCCNPWEVTVYWDGEEQSVDVRRGDGSE